MKQKLHHTLFAFLLLSIGCTQQVAASTGIAVTLLGYTIDSTLNVNLGYTLTISTQVTNTDSANSFTGQLDFGLHSNTQTLTTANIFNKPPYSNNTISLAPNESVPAIFSVHITPQYFVPGPDVVVVWPISTSPITDSVRIPLNILNPSGVQEEKKDLFTYIITEKKILLQNLSSQTNFKQVRIYNLMGQPISYLSSDFITEIPVPDLPRGIYICELITSTNARRVIKFLH